MGRDADAQPEFDRCMQLQPPSRLRRVQREIDGYSKRIKAMRGVQQR
jgi:hypothetical protein